MVELAHPLDSVFVSLANVTRRDILRRVANEELTVSKVAESYPLTLAAVSKHLKVLERAQLIKKSRRGNEQMISLVPETLEAANRHLAYYQAFWTRNLDALDTYITNREKQ